MPQAPALGALPALARSRAQVVREQVELYGTLRDTFGHFPLMNFWGPMTNIKATAWICDSAAYAMQQFRPNFC